jgi:hypothetical protein
LKSYLSALERARSIHRKLFLLLAIMTIMAAVAVIFVGRSLPQVHQHVTPDQFAALLPSIYTSINNGDVGQSFELPAVECNAGIPELTVFGDDTKLLTFFRHSSKQNQICMQSFVLNPINTTLPANTMIDLRSLHLERFSWRKSVLLGMPDFTAIEQHFEKVKYVPGKSRNAITSAEMQREFILIVYGPQLGKTVLAKLGAMLLLRNMCIGLVVCMCSVAAGMFWIRRAFLVGRLNQERSLLQLIGAPAPLACSFLRFAFASASLKDLQSAAILQYGSIRKKADEQRHQKELFNNSLVSLKALLQQLPKDHHAHADLVRASKEADTDVVRANHTVAALRQLVVMSIAARNTDSKMVELKTAKTEHERNIQNLRHQYEIRLRSLCLDSCDPDLKQAARLMEEANELATETEYKKKRSMMTDAITQLGWASRKRKNVLVFRGRGAGAF